MVCWYPMNILIKTRSISSKTDQDTEQDTEQDTDQETWILISFEIFNSFLENNIL